MGELGCYTALQIRCVLKISEMWSRESRTRRRVQLRAHGQIWLRRWALSTTKRSWAWRPSVGSRRLKGALFSRDHIGHARLLRLSLHWLRTEGSWIRSHKWPAQMRHAPCWPKMAHLQRHISNLQLAAFPLRAHRKALKHFKHQIAGTGFC